MDFVGPLEETTRGNKYILTITDLFSKWPVAYPLPSKEAENVAVCLINMFSNYGFPQAILSDNGSEFCNKVIKIRCNLHLIPLP